MSLRTFKYSVSPHFSTEAGDTDLHCDFEVIECRDEELRANIVDFMHKDFSNQLRKNPRLHPSLLQMARDGLDTSMIFTFSLTFFQECGIIYNDEEIGNIAIDVPIKKVGSLYKLHEAIEVFTENINMILEGDNDDV